MEKLFLEVFNLSITAGYLIAVVIIVRLLLKKAPKSVACVLWLLVGVRLICPFDIESIFSLLPDKTIVEEHFLYEETNIVSLGEENPPLFMTNGDLTKADTQAARNHNKNTKFSISDIVKAASYVWLAGIGVMLGYLAVSWRRIQKSVRLAIPMEYDGMKYYQCDNIFSPFLFGIVNPKIYVPSYIARQELSYVLRHENAHKHRRDYIIKPIGYLLLTLYWFHPLVWAAYILLCQDIELACDERVISRMDTAFKKEYSQALLSCSVSHRTIAACPVAFGEIGVKNRVKNVLNYKKPTFWAILAAAAACVVITVCFATRPKEEQSAEHANTDTDEMQIHAAVEEYVTIDDSKVFPLYIPAELAEALSFETPSDYELLIQSADKQYEIGRMRAMSAGEIVSTMEEDEYYTIGDYGDNGRLKDLYNLLGTMQISNVPEEQPAENGGTLFIPNADATQHPELLPNAGDAFEAGTVKGKDLPADTEINTENEHTITETDYGYIFIPAAKTAWDTQRAEELETLQNELVSLLPTVKVHVINVVNEAEVYADEADTTNPIYYDFVEQWAEAFCDRDGETITRLAGETAEQSLIDRELLSSGVDDEGHSYASFGWSSPWPWGSEDSALKNYRILSASDKTAVILYYAWVSDPHVTVWREVLTYEMKNGEFTITSEELSYQSGICIAEEFYQAYPDGKISGTMMDYYQGNGSGEVLNRNAMSDTGSYYQQLLKPDTAAVYLLNILNNSNKVKTTVTQADESGEAVVAFEFLEDGSTASVKMIQPYGNDGIWVPQTDNTAVNLAE